MTTCELTFGERVKQIHSWHLPCWLFLSTGWVLSLIAAIQLEGVSEKLMVLTGFVAILAGSALQVLILSMLNDARKAFMGEGLERYVQKAVFQPAVYIGLFLLFASLSLVM